MTSIFISYSRKNTAFVEKLHSYLNEWGYEVWIDVENIRVGDDWHGAIDTGLISTDLVIGVMSPEALESEMVKYEWDWTIENGKPFAPIYYKSCEDLLGYERYQYIDFRSSEETGFESLRANLLKILALSKSTVLSPEIRNLIEKYWQLARRFFIHSDFALSAFFAITLIEEIGTMLAISYRRASINPMLEAFFQSKNATEDPIELASITMQQKLCLAINHGLEMNSRVTNKYRQEEIRFTKWFREQSLPKLRDHALLMHGTSTDVSLPSDSITCEHAFALVVMAGSLYAEIQGSLVGVVTSEWERILNEVDDFADKNRS